MKHRFLLHSLNHTVLIVDISQFGMNIEVSPPHKELAKVPALRFINWKEAEQFFRAKRVADDTIGDTRITLAKNGVAVMTVV